MSDQDWNHQDKEPWEYEDKTPAEPKQDDSPADGAPPQDGSAPADGGSSDTPGDAGQGGSAGAPQDQTPPYQNPGQPYGGYPPYGQQGVAGSDQNGGQNQGQTPPYQHSGQPYGGYSPYGQQYTNPGGYGRYDNPYGPPNGQPPYWNGYGAPTPPPPHKMGLGLKIFLWVLGVVAVGLTVALIVFPQNQENMDYGRVSSAASPSSAAPQSPGSSSAAASSSSGPVIGGVQGDGTSSGFSGITIQSQPTGTPMTATNVYKGIIQSVVSVEAAISASQATGGASGTSEGTGIVATKDGYILTNAHVVNDTRSINVKVVLHNNQQYEAKVVGYDKTSDLAVLKINANNLSPATFGNVDSMQIGDQVIAIGNPGGLSFAGSLTGGYISALNRTIESYSDNGLTYIQTDAAINPGNSGGPLVNMYGQVIGINSNKIVATGYEGMGFAIPISRAQGIINELIQKGYVSGRTRLGITGQTVDDARAQLLGYPQGVVIRSIDSDSDMARAGAKAGDIITKADGKTITSLDDLYAILNAHKPGDVVSMTIYTSSSTGNGTNKNISVKLLEDKGQTQK